MHMKSRRASERDLFCSDEKKGSGLFFFFSQAMSQGGKCVCKCGWIVEVEILLAPTLRINAATGLVAQKQVGLYDDGYQVSKKMNAS